MSPNQAGGALGVVGVISALGLLLPGIDKAWSGDPSDTDTVRRVRFGEGMYLGSALVLSLLASYAQGDAAPLVLGMTLAAFVVAAHEYALRQGADSDDARPAVRPGW